MYLRRDLIVRLACMKHAASVRPEPGSNSPLSEKFIFTPHRCRDLTHYLSWKCFSSVLSMFCCRSLIFKPRLPASQPSAFSLLSVHSFTRINKFFFRLFDRFSIFHARIKRHYSFARFECFRILTLAMLSASARVSLFFYQGSSKSDLRRSFNFLTWLLFIKVLKFRVLIRADTWILNTSSSCTF